MFQGITKYNKINLAVVAMVVAMVLAAVILYMYFHIETFLDVSPSLTKANLFNDPRYEKNRTLLYGSLFLDKLDEQIKGMTDPRIQYDTFSLLLCCFVALLLCCFVALLLCCFVALLLCFSNKLFYTLTNKYQQNI